MTHTTSRYAAPADLLEVLADARARTWTLIAPLSDEELRTQHDALMSPILWDLGHIAEFEALWLTHNLAGPITFGEMPGLYNPFENPRATRGDLPLPDLAGTRATLDEVRGCVVASLGTLVMDEANPLLRDGFVVRMVAQHEYQHGETMLQALQLKEASPYAAPRAWEPPEPRLDLTPGTMLRCSGGTIPVGTDDRSTAYDNERPQHWVTLAPFWIDQSPVTNSEFLAFIDAGGYKTPAWWTDAGWNLVTTDGLEAPKYWRREGHTWETRFMDRVVPVDPRSPVCHVSWYEADAYARWAGKRLPAELEWEAAAAWDPDARLVRPYPWGYEPPTRSRANVDQLSFETAPVGAYPENVSPIGCYGMLGDVWEWTASSFTPYPGFEAFPYPEYSEAFFGEDSKVLRGGSWATRPGAVRNTFRNWDYPVRRQIFSGFRCARDD